MNRERQREIIGRLRAVASSSTHPAEQEAFAVNADRLMRQWGITEDEMERDSIRLMPFGTRGKMKVYETMLVDSLARMYDLTFVQQHNEIFLQGRPGLLAVAAADYEYWSLKIWSLARAVTPDYAQRCSFAMGYISMLDIKARRRMQGLAPVSTDELLQTTEEDPARITVEVTPNADSSKKTQESSRVETNNGNASQARPLPADEQNELDRLCDEYVLIGFDMAEPECFDRIPKLPGASS